MPRRAGSARRFDQSWRAILIVVIFALALLLLSRLPVWRLKTVELQGDQDEAVALELKGLLGQSIFSSAVSRMSGRQKANLAVADFVCQRGLPNSLKCTLRNRVPALIWRTGNKEYFVDRSGFLFAEKTGATSGLLTLEDSKLQPVSRGAIVTSPEIIEQYQELVEKLSAKQIAVTALVLNESLYQIIAKIDRAGRSPIQLLLLLTNDIDIQLESIQAVLAQKNDSITESIDARVPGYIYTK